MSKRPGWWLPFLARIWPITWNSAKATRWPLLGGLIAKIALPLFSKKNLNISYIPVNRDLERADDTPLPREIVEELIVRSSHRVIISKCTCRDASSCKNHPVGYGCTLLGEGTRGIDPRIARHVSAEEAVEHLRRTLEDGLIPMIGRVRIDNFIWGVRDRGRLLTVCHCCECCCTLFRSGKYLPADAARSMVRLSGLSIRHDPGLCTHCGACAGQCFMGAVSVTGGSHNIDMDKCKGCGRCVTVCPQKALSLAIENREELIAELMGRIERNVNYR